MVRNNIMPVSSKDIENHLILHRHASIAFLDVIKKNDQFRQCEEIPPARSKLRPESKSASSLPETSACSRAQYIANYTIDLSQRSPGTNFLQYFITSLGSQGNIPILSFPIFRRDTSTSRSPCFLRAKHFLSLTLNSNVTFPTAQCHSASLMFN